MVVLNSSLKKHSFVAIKTRTHQKKPPPKPQNSHGFAPQNKSAA